MEAKLAEYRARKANEERRSQTAGQRLLGLFRRTNADESLSKREGTTSPTNSTSTDHSNQQTTALTQEEDEEDVTEPDPPPGKYHWLLLGLKVVLWWVVWMVFIELQFGAVFFAVSALAFVYFNTRTGKKGKKKSLSAYSVFNPNCERLQGTITAEQLEGEILYRKPLVTS